MLRRGYLVINEQGIEQPVWQGIKVGNILNGVQQSAVALELLY